MRNAVPRFHPGLLDVAAALRLEVFTQRPYISNEEPKVLSGSRVETTTVHRPIAMAQLTFSFQSKHVRITHCAHEVFDPAGSAKVRVPALDSIQTENGDVSRRDRRTS